MALCFNWNTILTSNFESDRIWTTKLLESEFESMMIQFVARKKPKHITT